MAAPSQARVSATQLCYAIGSDQQGARYRASNDRMGLQWKQDLRQRACRCVSQRGDRASGPVLARRTLVLQLSR